MQAVTARWNDAVRSGGVVYATCTHRNLLTGAANRVPVGAGSTVTIDVNSPTRWTLALNTAAQQSTWDFLDTPGGEITTTVTRRYVDGKTETIPMGVFIVDQDAIGYSTTGAISIVAPDHALKIRRNRFRLARKSVPTNTVPNEIKRLAEACWDATYPFPGWAQFDTTVTAKVGHLLWDDGDREKAIADLARAHGLEFYFNAAGKAVLRPVPAFSSTSPAAWRVDAGDTGVMVGADRGRDRSRTRNVVVVSSTANMTTVPASVEVANTTVGDPLNITGPLGAVPFYYSSPLLRNTTQMLAAGKTILRRQLGSAAQMSLSSAPNHALEGGDIVGVVLPQIDRNTPRGYELHVLDQIVHPLWPGDPQTMETRSTRPDTDGE